MNDIVLSCLLNLFALQSHAHCSDRAKAETVLRNYLVHHFGVMDIEEQLDFYNSLLSSYGSSEDIDFRESFSDTCGILREKLTSKDRVFMALRLLEMRSMNGDSDLTGEEMIAEGIGIDSSTMENLSAFVSGRTDNPEVRTMPYAGGSVRTLLLEPFETIVFAYDGPSTVLYNDGQVLNGSFLVWERSGVMKSASEKPLYYYNVTSLYSTDESHRTILKLRGDSIDFRYPGSDAGIHDFTFNLYSGELVAIMGGSGTGKTTLLSLLSGSLRPQEGRISINGHSLDEPEARSLIGFVPQDDLLISELSVYENLLFTARLCFAGLSENELEEKAMSMLRSLGLEAYKDLKAGSPLDKYISGGQRKRLNIALELIREPDILYLDEPTSGLSSADTLAVMNLLREQAYKGRLIIANIHQPSSDVFKMFDRLWVLDTGGYPVYDGNPVEAVTWFKKVAGYMDAETGICPTCGNVDSESILSIIDEKMIAPDGTVAERRKVTPEQWHSLYLKTAAKSKDKVEDLPPSDQERPGRLKQIWIYLRRNIKAKVADRQWLLIMLIEAPLLALICALLTHYAPENGYSIMDNKNFVSYMFMAVIVATFLGMSGSAEEIIKDRALLKREKFLNLSYGSYIFSKIVFMAGVSLIQTLLFVICGNLIIGFHSLFWQWCLILFATEMLAALIGLVLSQWLRSVVSIYITIPILLIPQILLCGLVVDFNDLVPESKTGNVPLIGEVIPSRWAFEALAVTTFTDNPYEKPLFETDRERFQYNYYSSVYLKELKRILKDPEGDKDVIQTSLPLILEISGVSATDSLTETLDLIGEELQKKVTRANLRHYRETDLRGGSETVALKKASYNLALEGKVLNESSKKFFAINDGQIVPRAEYIFLDPMDHDGRAHFYSSVKILGNLRVKTLWFNLFVILAMGMICTGILLINFPEKTIFRKYFKK